MTRTVRVGDLSLVCHVSGRGPLCVAHPGGPGLLGDYLRMPLLERDLTMVYLEPAGTGASGPLARGAKYDLETYAAHLDAVVAELSDGPVLVLGHGHGGFVAQKYALGNPGRIAGLILYATSPLADQHTRAAARERLQRYARANADRADPEAMIAAYDRPADRSVHETTARLWGILPALFGDYWQRRREFAPLLGALPCWPRPAAEFDFRADLRSITAPTMVLWGTHDFEFGDAAARMLRSGIPGAHAAEFRDSAHFAHMEEAERFSYVVTEFARRVSDGVSGEFTRPGRNPHAGLTPDHSGSW
ncbi:hydrolase [Paractinoplanes durhamensis]|uniref:Hydrolase n=2 Tax=Paractinoplanes durhamensis TaxID=113563 RepID=A0ABQ3Z7A2_9ACTN|nr:hydrolase [Actinoplanes durhamensis]